MVGQTFGMAQKQFYVSVFLVHISLQIKSPMHWQLPENYEFNFFSLKLSKQYFFVKITPSGPSLCPCTPRQVLVVIATDGWTKTAWHPSKSLILKKDYYFETRPKSFFILKRAWLKIQTYPLVVCILVEKCFAAIGQHTSIEMNF